MMASETDPLLSRDNPVGDIPVRPNNFWMRGCHRLPLETVFVLYGMPAVMTIPVVQFYIYDKVAREHGIEGYIVDQKTSSCKQSGNISQTFVTIQEVASQNLMYLSFTSLFAAVIPTLFLGTVADKFGRKSAVLISVLGTLVKQIFCVFIFYYDLDLVFLYLAQVIEGLCGNFFAVLMAAFAMISDITEPNKSRGVRISILEGILATCSAIAMLMGGLWIQESGFFIPMVVSASLCFLDVFLVIFCLTETKKLCPVTSQRKICTINNITRCFTFYVKDTQEKRRSKMIFLLILFALVVVSLLSKSNIFNLFVLNKPFCWTALHISLLNAVQIGLNWALSVLILKLLLNCIRDSEIIILGCAFGVFSLIILALAQRDYFIYMYAVICTIPVLAVPLIRTMMSKLCTSQEHGAMFAGLACIESLSMSLSNVLLNEVYKASVGFYPGLVFLGLAGLSFFTFIAACILDYLIRSNIPRDMIITVDSPQEETKEEGSSTMTNGNENKGVNTESVHTYFIAYRFRHIETSPVHTLQDKNYIGS